MRKFLLWAGTTWVGMTTIVVVLSTMIIAGSDGSSYAGQPEKPGAGALLLGIFVWLFALAFGIALSAPAFLNPPEDNGGFWAFRVPLPLWMFLMMLKLASWIGFYILLGVWMLIFKLWNNRQNNRLPSFSNAPQTPNYGSQPTAPRPIPPSWQHDPTGRYAHRWWDGTRWTNRVANGSFQAVDPL
ncbi:DUF2510 domain-containing protein [Actinoplanes sp. NPDC049596]|uniref:DUF2510 domain-containing protein n=1 Tax=unclassified Actinoplanes TaxID=2626549 RepID=UPI00342DBF18